MAFVHDHSGKLFKGKKVTLRDVVANGDAAELYLCCLVEWRCYPHVLQFRYFSLGNICNDESHPALEAISLCNPGWHPTVLYRRHTLSSWTASRYGVCDGLGLKVGGCPEAPGCWQASTFTREVVAHFFKRGSDR